MPLTLLMRLEGPLQSWGSRSRFKDRDTGLEPTKSGVIGLLCCALGQQRNVPPANLATLRMHVRVEKQGRILEDFQTAGGGIFRGDTDYFAPTSGGGRRNDPIIQSKHYLQDAKFTVALEGDEDLLRSLATAIQDPAWPLSLGRRSCPPSVPVFLSLEDDNAESCLRNLEQKDDPPRFVWELEPGRTDGEPRQDLPIAWPDRQTREYSIRYVRQEVST